MRIVILLLLLLSFSGLGPPKTAQPFLPKTVNDIFPNCYVKVINPQGKVVVGKVKFCGHVPEKSEPYVGIELFNGNGGGGSSDGTFMGHRFFDW